MLDYQALLYDVNYGQFGVTASLQTDHLELITITVIDKTTEQALPHPAGGDEFLTTLEPKCILRGKELIDAGYTREDLDGAQIDFNGKSWRVESHMPRPAPTRELTGEYILLLTEIVDG